MAAYMTEHDLGPHRGVRAIGDYLAAEQAAGRVRGGRRPARGRDAVRRRLLHARVAAADAAAEVAELPALEDIIDAIEALLRPGA